METRYNTNDKIYTEEDVKSAFKHAYFLGCSDATYDVDKSFTEWDKEYIANTRKEITLQSILRVVSWLTGVEIRHISNTPNKKGKVTLARQYVNWFLYHYTDMTAEAIADETMARTHAVALHRVRAINDLLFYDNNIKNDIERMKIKLIMEGYGLSFSIGRNVHGKGRKEEVI